MKIYFAALLISFTLIMVSSCTQSSESLVTPSSTMSVTATSTRMPTPSFTPLSTATPVLILTPTIVPTWPVEAAQARFLNLLSNNDECQLSCLWGIVPGKTSFQEAQAILAPLVSISEFTAFESGIGSITPSFTEGDLQVYSTIDFISNPETGIVNSIAFNAELHRPLAQGGYEDVFDSIFFGEKISAYTLPQVLSKLGIPESVSISTFGGPLTRGGKGGFDLLVLYPNKGILINYTTQMNLSGREVRGCLTNAHVEMELYPPGQPALFSESLKKTDWAVKMNYYKSLEEVTSMSVQDFYETFREPNNMCIETPAEVWPVPEP